MPEHKITFTGGQQRDWSLDAQPPNTFRDALNMDFRKRESLTAVSTIGGTELISTLFGVDIDVNVLAMERCEGLYDLDGDGEYEIDEESLVILTWDSSNGSRITMVRLSTGADYVLYDSSGGDKELAFPPTGTAHGFYERERGTPTYTWADDTSPLRKVLLRYSSAVPGSQMPYRMLWLRPPLFGENPTVSAVEDGGALPCGGYSFMVRWWSREYCRGSSWSLPTNVVPITPEDPLPLEGEFPRGGRVGEGSNRRVVLDVSDTPGTGFKDPWDSLQVLIIPYTDGSNEQPATGILLEPKADWYNAMQIIVSNTDGLQVPLEDYVVDDAPLIRAKSILAKENYAFAGNVKYQPFDPRPGIAGTRFTGAVRAQKAETIAHEVDGDRPYWDELDCVNKRGHFRGEQYAYGVTHYDEFGNFGPVQPLDLSEFWSCARHPDWPAGTQVDSFTVEFNTTTDDEPAAYVEITTETATPGMASLISVGDYICIDSSDRVWRAISATEVGANTLIRVRPLGEENLLAASGEIVAGASFHKGYGQQGNLANNWAWKYAERHDNQLSLVSSDDQVRALGLRLKGVRNHPLWSRGFAVVRQARKRNLLYQGISVPPMAAIGGVTPGANAARNVELPNDGEDVNTYAPHLYIMGAARDLVTIKDAVDPTAMAVVLEPSVWWTQQVGLQGHLISWFQPPGFMANRTGTEIVRAEEDLLRTMRVVDAVAMARTNYLYDTSSEGALMTAISETLDVFKADKARHFFYRDAGFVFYGSVAGSVTSGLQGFFVTPSEFASGISTPTGGLPMTVDIDGIQALSLGHERQFLGLSPDQSEIAFLLAGLATKARWSAVRFWNGLRELTRQQDDNAAIPAQGRFTGFIENQRGILVKVNSYIGDFTHQWITGLNASAPETSNAFPDLDSDERPSTERAISDDHLDASYELNVVIGTEIPMSTLPADNEDTDEHHATGFIVNVERGLGDDRYGEFGEDAVWYPTGAVVPLTEAEVADNTPKDVDVWGGDCFITKFRQKVSAGAGIPRTTGQLRDVLADLDAPTEEGGAIDSISAMLNQKGPKVGTMDSFAQVLEYFVESEINCNFFSQDNVYPRVPTEDAATNSSFLKSWTYDYNPGYSAEARAKLLVSIIDLCEDNNGEYPARVHISDKRVYQAEQQGLVDVQGFDRWRSASTFDAEEGYGEITALIDNGGGLLHTIQEFGVRYDPINRDFVEVGDNTQLVLGRSPIGRGGRYMAIKDGCQHIRTVVQDNGQCYFVSAREGVVLSFGTGGSMWTLSEQGIQSQYMMSDYFRELLAGKSITELQLDAGFDRDRGEYWIIGRGWGSTDAVTIRFSRELNGWIGRFAGPDNTPLLRMASGFGGYYALTHDNTQESGLNLHRMHTGAPSTVFGSVVDSELQVVLNLPDDAQKTFGVVQLQGQGGANTLDATVVKADGSAQVATGVPFVGPKNGWYRANALREDTVRARLRGSAALVTLKFDMGASPARRIFDSVIYSSRASAKNY